MRPDSSRSGSRRSSMPLANDSLSPFCRGRTCRWMWRHGLEGGLAVVDDDVVAVGMKPRLAGGPGDALTEGDHASDRVRRCVGQVDRVALRNYQGVAAGERPDVEDGQVVVVLVDPDGRGLAGDDGAEDTGHPATLAGQLPTFSLAHSAMRRSGRVPSGETSNVVRLCRFGGHVVMGATARTAVTCVNQMTAKAGSGRAVTPCGPACRILQGLCAWMPPATVNTTSE